MRLQEYKQDYNHSFTYSNSSLRFQLAKVCGGVLEYLKIAFYRNNPDNIYIGYKGIFSYKDSQSIRST